MMQWIQEQKHLLYNATTHGNVTMYLSVNLEDGRKRFFLEKNLSDCIRDVQQGIPPLVWNKWNLDIIFAVDTGNTVFTADYLQEMQVRINEIQRWPGYEDYCWRGNTE